MGARPGPHVPRNDLSEDGGAAQAAQGAIPLVPLAVSIIAVVPLLGNQGNRVHGGRGTLEHRLERGAGQRNLGQGDNAEEGANKPVLNSRYALIRFY